MKNLVIVESPTKARTIGKFLGKNYAIESSFGHVRDLPKSKMGIDFENNFEPQYVIPLKAKKRVSELKKRAQKASAVYFATDSDREGEAISWHLQHILGIPDAQVKRIAFHEITKKAILEALERPETLNLNLVNAQQARRVLDRLVGYELSPLLWKKVARGLSAGRVQSVAVRLIVEREAEISSFKTQEYWTVEGSAEHENTRFPVALSEVHGKKLGKFELDRAAAEEAAGKLRGKTLAVTDIKSRSVTKSPPPPYTTAALQIDANHRLGFSAKQTMMLAQQLYEGIDLGARGSAGLITYMRTDSLNLAADFLAEANTFITEHFGSEYGVSGGRHYKSRSKNAQEAHEAIRPTAAANTPDAVRPHLDDRQFKLYALIWSRTMASQMQASVSEATAVELEADNLPYTLKATGTVLKFDGWQKVYSGKQQTEARLPKLTKGDSCALAEIQPLQHFTQPPARYSEAGLVKALEELGIGRPSTYAPTIATIQDRKYVEKGEDKRLRPTQIGTLVNDLLVAHFAHIVDYNFTAAMEENLDKIARGEAEWQPVIRAFYEPFKKDIEQKQVELDKKEITEQATEHVCEKCGRAMVIKIGRFGRFLACTGFPECRNTKQLNGSDEIAETETADEQCPQCGKPLSVKRGRFGSFLGCTGYPDCKYIKKQQQSTGVTCPQCSTGDIVGKKSKRGKLFYSCSRYPECDYALWQKPTGDKCPSCGSLLTYGARDTIRCSQKQCAYSRPAAG